MITHASTFSGIGAPEIAAEMLGWENLFHCEINPFGRRVLDYYFPNSKSYEDITKTDFSEWRGRVTVLTGGFPCQPFSYAGKRRGAEDDRYLWPYMLRCIEQVRPTWFIGENVGGIVTMAIKCTPVSVEAEASLFGENDCLFEQRQRFCLDEIIENLEKAGYTVQPVLIPACAVGAPHRRDRVFIIAHRVAESITDTNGCDNGTRSPVEYESKSGEERLSKRNAIQFTEQSAEVRPPMGRPTPDPSCSGSGAQAESERLIAERSERLARAKERGVGSERTDGLSALQGHTSYTPSQRRREIYEQVQSKLADGAEPFGNGRERNVTDTQCEGLQARLDERGNGIENRDTPSWRSRDCSELYPENRWRTFPSVSPVYRGNDGLPFPVDHLSIPFSEWKRESLKAYGNAIVPQVMYEIFRAIEYVESLKGV